MTGIFFVYNKSNIRNVVFYNYFGAKGDKEIKAEIKNILNDKAIPMLVEKVNKHIQEQSESNQIIIENGKKELYNVDKQINNIVSAIA